MTLPKEGQKAPAFSAKDETGKTHKLADYKGRTLVLYFYPRDDTPGCTKEACNFRDNLSGLTKLGAAVLGVSRDTEASHQKFKAKFHLNFPLLVDGGAVSDAYGTWVEKNMYGRTYMGIQRATFLIGPDGTIEKVWEKSKPETIAAEVADAIKILAPGARGR